MVLCSFILSAQDSIQLQASINEDKNTKFQQLFFKALSEKAINNHQKAIEALDECNALLPRDKAVLFELSKNYFKLNRNFEALEYANSALLKEPNNLWVLEHKVAIHRKSRSFSEAVKIQEKIALLFPKKKRKLVYLHLQNNNIVAAKRVLNELASAKLLDARLRRIQDKINDSNSLAIQRSSPKKTENTNLKDQFKKDKRFTILQKLLTELDTNNDVDLLVFSEQGLSLFPAQPLVYLMNGKALNKNNQFKKAVTSLQNGIDFVIDNPTMESNFYKELIKAYEKLGDRKNVSKFKKKLKAL